MIRNYIKIALRNFKRFKGYTAINLTGLALGLTCGILIMLFVLDELSFDKFHKNYNRIYKVYSGNNETNGWPIGVKIAEFPEVESVVYSRGASYLQVMHENQRFNEKPFYASKDFFKIFSFDFISGNPQTAQYSARHLPAPVRPYRHRAALTARWSRDNRRRRA